MLTSMATEVLGMPALGPRRAPDFDSRNLEELKEFLEEFEGVGRKIWIDNKRKGKNSGQVCGQEDEAVLEKTRRI